MRNLLVIRGWCKWGTGQRLFYTYKLRGGTFSRKHMYGADTFFIHCYALFFTLDTICPDNNDKYMAG